MKSLNEIWNNKPIRGLKIAGSILGMVFLCGSCELGTEQDNTITYYEDFDLSITKYFESNPERFSILSDILDTTGLDNLFRTYGDYTFMAPTDSAFEDYFKEKGKSTYLDFETEELIQLIKYQVFDTRIMSGGFNSGIVESKTLGLDYMVSGLSDNGSDVILNKRARIISKDNINPNGIIHEIDQVLEKPETSIYDWVAENQADYSIFKEALEKTGLYEMFGKEGVDSSDFYSCFITPDDKYAENSISSFAELAQLISPDDNHYTDSANSLWSYIGSHFLPTVVSMSDATEDQEFFGSVGGATSKFGLKPSSADIVINYNTSDFPEGLKVDAFNSNNLVSNGIVHVMDTMFQVTKTFDRTLRYFVFADVPGVPYDELMDYGIGLWEEQGIKAKESGDNGDVGSEKWLLGQWSQFWPRPGDDIHLPFDETDGWLTLNAPYSGKIRTDHHRNDEYNNDQDYLFGNKQPIFFTNEKCEDLLDITRKFPYIIPGKYKLVNHTKAGTERPAIRHTFDGQNIGGIVNLALQVNGFQALDVGVVEIKEGESEHFLRIQEVTPGKAFFIAISFVPID